MTKPTATPTLLSEDETPKFWFLKTDDDRSREYPRMKMLPNQWVPDYEEPELFFQNNPDWNVKCDRKIRSAFPEGTVFVTTGIQVYSRSNCYNVPTGSSIHPLVDHPFHSDYPPATDEMKEHYEAYLQGEPRPKKTTVDIPETVTPTKGLLQKIMNDEALTPPTAEDGFYVDPDLWYFLVRNVLQKENTLIVGPTGCGKTEIVKLMSRKLSLAFNKIDMEGMQDAISGLLGVHRLEGTKSFWDYSRFSKVIQEPGIILLDEISRAPAGANNILFPVLDSSRELRVEYASSDEQRSIPVHPDAIFFATANIGLEYTGTTALDRALLDRFFPAEIDYMTSEQEAAVLISRTGIEKKTAEVITNVAQVIRNKAANGDLSTAVSTRHTIGAAKLVKDGFPLLKSLERIFLPMFEGNSHDGERANVKSILASK